jgi:iron complex outermembrane receptor protein
MLLSLILLLPLSARAEEETAASEHVVIEAPRLVGREAWDTPAAVTVFTIDEHLRPGTDLGQLVGRAPGVQLQQFGDQDDFQGVSIRGSTMRQVAVFMDGIPLNPEGGESVNLTEWPLRALQRVEVYRGFAPADLGGAAIGGAIDLVPRENARGLSGGLSAARYGRFGIDGFMAGALGAVGSTLFVDAHRAEGDYPYFTDNGTPYTRLDDRWLSRANNRSHHVSALGRATARLGGTRLTLLDAWLSRAEGLPGHVNNPSADAQLKTARNLLGLRAETSLGDHKLTATGWWLARTTTYDDRGDELGLGAQWEQQRARHLGLRLHEQLAWAGGQHLGLSASARQESGTTENLLGTGSAPPQQRTVETLTADAEILRGGLGVTPVVHSTFLQGEQIDPLASVEPRLGLRWSAREQLVLRATGGRYLRPPDLTELFGDRGSMLGNPDLRPERGWQWDVGGRAKHSLGDLLSLEADVGHFWSASQDRIVWVQNSQRTMIPQNFDSTWVQGLEASLIAVAGLGLSSDTSLSWTRSANLSTNPAVANKQLPGVPTWSVWQALGWAAPGDRVRLAVDWRYTDGTYWDATNWYRAAPRSIMGASVQLQPSPSWPRLDLGLSNLLDHQVAVVDQNPLQQANSARVVKPLTDFAGHPLPGRVWTLGLRWEPRRAS